MTPDNKIDLANAVKAGAAVTAVKASNTFAEWCAAVGIHNWGEASQAAAFLLSICLIADFFWKRFFRKFAERRWPNRFPLRRKRRSDDFERTTDNAPLGEK